MSCDTSTQEREAEMRSLSSSEDTKPLLSSKTAKPNNDENIVQKKKGGFHGILSSLLYTIMSVSMVLVNKAISANLKPSVKERLPDFSEVFAQCLIAVVLVEAAKFIGVVEYPSFELIVAKAWLPVNLLFIGMLCSGFISLSYLSIPMATVLKNLTNMFTIFGDWYLFSEK
jgi:GDP-mannose transporter